MYKTHFNNKIKVIQIPVTFDKNIVKCQIQVMFDNIKILWGCICSQFRQIKETPSVFLVYEFRLARSTLCPFGNRKYFWHFSLHFTVICVNVHLPVAPCGEALRTAKPINLCSQNLKPPISKYNMAMFHVARLFQLARPSPT